MFNHLTIGARLWLNLIIVLALVGFVSWLGWQSTQFSVHQSRQLVNQHENLSAKIAVFHQHFIQTLQAANNYILTLDASQGNNFNQLIDQQITNLEQLLIELGAQISRDASGFLQFDTQPDSANQAHLFSLHSLDSILINLKKATNANVYLKQRLGTTLEFSLERSSQAFKQSLEQLQMHSTASPGLVTTIEALKTRLETSQHLAIKMISNGDIALKQAFDEQGLGFRAMPLLTQLEDQFNGDFFQREILQQVRQSHNDYFDGFGDLRDFIHTTGQNNLSLAMLSENGNMTLLNLTQSLQQQSLQALQGLENINLQQADKLMLFGLLAAFLLLIINSTITRSIVKPLNAMRDQVIQAAQTGDFSHWHPQPGQHELAQMSRAQHTLFNAISHALNELQTVSEALAQGNTQQRMSEHYQGDLAKLSQSINHSLNSINHTLQQMTQLSHALEEGELSFDVDLSPYQGQFLEVTQALTNALAVQKQAIDDIRRVTHAMRAGDFAQRVEMIMPGELHKLKRYLNESLERLEEAINNKSNALKAFSQGDFSQQSAHKFEGKLQELNMHMGNMAHSISRMLGDVKLATDHAVHGIKEISSGNQDLNKRVQKQAAAIQQTSLNMNQMRLTLDHTLEEANHVSSTTELVQRDSADGMHIVSLMVEAMQGIEHASQQISSITGLIDSIAFQTNLLALNASVEAARAGEAGRGFAVVATEVRYLAQRSAEAAQQIRQVTDTNITRINEGMLLSQQTQQVFEQNSASIERIAQMIIKMNQALARQSHGIHQVTEALGEIDESTQQNAALVEQIATTSSNIIEEVLGLEDKVSGFKLLSLPTRTHAA